MTAGFARAQGNVAYFDIWRALSSQAVLVGHALNIFLPAYFMSQRADGSFEASRPMLYIQNVGVVVFFALSGYLVTRAVGRRLDDPAYGIRQFAIDRTTRIFVPFLPAVALVWVFDSLLLGAGAWNAFSDLPLDAWTLLTNCLMLFNNPALSIGAKLTGIGSLYTVPIGTADPFWTVVLEWWIYVAFGILALVIGRVPKATLLAMPLLLFALAPPFLSLASGSGLVLAWPVGMLFALADDSMRNARRGRLAVVCAFAATFALLRLLRNGFQVYDPTVVLGISVALIGGSFVLRPPGVTQSRLGRWLLFQSDYSYSLYLVHFSVLIYLAEYLPRTLGPIASIVVGLLLANLVAACFWFLFERHYLAVRQWALRAFPGPSQPPPPLAEPRSDRLGV